jgi:steroid delta-isomerase-like uncharacterized protein
MPEHPNVEIVRRGYDAFNNRNMDALAALIAENVVWHVSGRSLLAGDYHGRETTFAYFDRLHSLTNGTYQSELHVAVGGDEHVISIDNSSARRNGRTYEENELVVFRFRDGRIVEAWQAFMSPYAHDAFFSTTAPHETGGLPVKVARAYLRGWNDHDGAAVARLFATDGTYVDPTLPGPLSGEAIAEHVTGLVAAFPDLTFAVEGISVDGDRVTVQWRMQGTNTGPFREAPQPTGSSCDLRGVDVITVGSAGITSVVGYFDQKTLFEQLGLQALIVSADEWPLHYGIAVRTDLGITTVPGAITMTWIDVDSVQEQDEVALRAKNVIEALASEPGFIGWVGAFSGHRAHTLTAWTSPEAAQAAISRNSPHRLAKARVMHGKLGRHFFTSFWKPHHLNDQVGTCPNCDRMVPIAAHSQSAHCECGGEVAVTSYI